jgi:peptidoglycan/xylan/chitin deacetylase (PgdA/CDA1 family)
MYFNNKNNFFHGIMFHHFYNDNLHKKSQGSINKDDFYKMLKFIGRENILDANDFFTRLKENKLKEKNVCLTFDDAIKCQYDIALPVLEDLKIKSFFFIYSSLFKGELTLLEVYRYFRMNYFNNIDEFYNYFFILFNKDLCAFFKDNEKIIEQTKVKFLVYSTNDIKFRLVRDKLLSQLDYKKIMFAMFKEKNFRPEDHYKNIFMSKFNLNKLNELGHLIGLHSHSHPVLLENLSYNEQKKEYENNKSTLSEILNIDKNNIKYMSHPSGSYNRDALKLVEELKIALGFKQIMSIEPEKNMKKINNSSLEIARQDHAKIIKMMN